MSNRNSKPKSANTPDVITFDNTEIKIINQEGEQWLTAADISRALDYSRSDAVVKIYDRNQDEFDDSMTCTTKLGVQGQRREVRVFNKRGCQLIALLARTPKSKAFRKWVLDVLAGNQDNADSAHHTPRIEDHSISYVVHKMEGTKVVDSNMATVDYLQGLIGELYPDMLLIDRRNVGKDVDAAMNIMQQAIATAAQTIQPFQLLLEHDDMDVAISRRMSRVTEGLVGRAAV